MSAIVGEIVEPYAQALMSVAKSNNLTNEIGDILRSLLELMENSEPLRKFLGNPVIKRDDKKAVIGQIFREEANPYVRNFAMLLVDRGRISFLEPIAKQYLALLRQLNKTVLAEVTSAIELNDGQKHTLCEKVKGITGAENVEIITKTDPDLLGGVIIKVGSQVIDASLRGQLRRIGIRLNA
ncbi:MAG: ATP synthase F1 subunit delta [Limnoraphis robusta]|jgi:F-type H+-transporting ATPase subunit delta|uniref:ATP synthase F1 subunit delta n=1 Tax=Limnoraphis robusta TaxID=1118279 RepID=UPI001F9E98E4|nr:ATP synthase F1 subunit delta [Limnoraphis robusta]MCG5056807.1 F0F1 ATP synthase subunit delta [Limnoraphis sp. WC205]MEA5499744.1 ATP synthase F1 subunit delta [Limnoraphis robusta BA-68 BA1]